MSPLDGLPPELAALISQAIQDGIAKGVASIAPAAPVPTAPKTDITFAEAVPAYEEWTKVKISSHRILRANLKTAAAICGTMPLSQFTPGWADLFYVAMAKTKTRRNKPPSPTYVQRILTSIHSMLTWHVQQGTIASNPLSGFRRIDEEPYARQTVLNEEEFSRFIAQTPPLFQDIMTVAFRCVGMRHGEVRELHKEEVDMEAMLITLNPWRTKKRKARVIPFPTEVKEILERNMAISRGKYVFVRPRDPKRMDVLPQGTIYGWLNLARKTSGMHGVNGEQIVIHSARHSGVTQIITDGGIVPHVQAAAGLSDRVLKRYSKFAPAQQAILRELMERQADRVGPRRADTARHVIPPPLSSPISTNVQAKRLTRKFR